VQEKFYSWRFLGGSIWVFTCLWETHLENEFTICLILSVHMKILVVERNHLYYLDTYRNPCTLPLRELLLPWEDICKHSTVNDKVMGTRNITQMSDYLFTPVRIKYILFVYKNTYKMLDRNLGETHLFSQHICQTKGIWECTKHLQIVSNENYIDFSLCLYNYKL
jgi:hypothetical protein